MCHFDGLEVVSLPPVVLGRGSSILPSVRSLFGVSFPSNSRDSSGRYRDRPDVGVQRGPTLINPTQKCSKSVSYLTFLRQTLISYKELQFVRRRCVELTLQSNSLEGFWPVCKNEGPFTNNTDGKGGKNIVVTPRIYWNIYYNHFSVLKSTLKYLWIYYTEEWLESSKTFCMRKKKKKKKKVDVWTKTTLFLLLRRNIYDTYGRLLINLYFLVLYIRNFSFLIYMVGNNSNVQTRVKSNRTLCGKLGYENFLYVTLRVWDLNAKIFDINNFNIKDNKGVSWK